MTSFIRKIIKAFKDPALPENYFRLEIYNLRAFGLEMLKEESWLYTIYSRITLLFLVYSFTAGESLEVYLNWGGLNALVDVVSYLFTHIGGAVKVTLLFYNRKKFGAMIRKFHAIPFAPNPTRGGNVEAEFIRKVIKITDIQFGVYMTFVSATLFIGGIRCSWSILFKTRNEWVVPFSPITILKHAGSPYFELGSLYQYVCVTLFAVIIVTVDVLLCCIMAQLSVQFKILRNAFENMRNRAKEMANIGPNPKNEEECMRIILGEYIHHHCAVFQLAAELEDLINVIVLGATGVDTILLCFLLYQCARYPIGSVTFLQNFFYYWIIVTQVSMYCYWGNEITSEAEELATAAGNVNWPGTSLSVPRGLVLVIARSQKPLFMTIGKFFPLSLTTLMSLLKGSFSYFTVMRQTNNMEQE
ncbi:odorant receptor Or2-like isoform X2 [Onthophagus taurus]|uniref:odorant receptor Or2-like isoform X2 n=1 Tax=Onthophagus taurus TaxID=166361 RepID=UPI0039BE2A3B